MKAYYLVQRQGGGCDYTIGCGIRIDKLTATSLVEARKEAAQTIGDSWHASSRNHLLDRRIDKAELLVVEEVENLEQFLTERANKRAETRAKREAEKKLAADRKKYEKLKKRFEGS